MIDTDAKKIFQAAEAQSLSEVSNVQIQAGENFSARNSFFDDSYFGTRVLILAPHPDDEINIAGNMILSLASAKAEIFVAYSTNGDFEHSAEKRAKEAVDALKILGVPRDRIIFLGYGDTFNGTGKPHIFSARTPTTSPAGFSETYAAKNFVDYAQKISGQHSPYTRENFKRDLKNLLLDLRANIIFCVDFDLHADHRTLSILFEEVLGEILSERNDYPPNVYKKFAYATAFTAKPDFYAPNLISTCKPEVGKTDTYNFDIIDRANYLWKNRVRFPISEECRQPLLKNNPIAEAIFAHKSQRIEWNALRILNSDEIFFERRTDSQTFSAKVTATSGDPTKVRDFKIIDTCDVDNMFAQIENNLWRPKDSERKIFFDWIEPIQVRRIVIYGNPLDDESHKISLQLDDSVKDFDLPSRGQPLIIDTRKILIKHAEISTSDAGENFGLAEVEFFANTELLRKIPPFIKLTIDDNFIYEYRVPFDIESIPLSLYRYNVEAPVKISAKTIEGELLSEQMMENKIILHLGTAKEIFITAEVVGSNIYDRSVIRRVNKFSQLKLKFLQWVDRLRIHKIRKINKWQNF